MQKKNKFSIKNVVSSNIIRLRKAENISQLELAKRVGLAHNFINDIENGRKGCSLDTIEKFVNYFNVAPYQLFLYPSQWGNAEKQGVIGMFEVMNKKIDLIFKDTIEEYRKNRKCGK
jgi:transcriptional regulator with XRE-family HTH domain